MPRTIDHQYLWNLVTMAVFYVLPVIQLVLTHQWVLNSTGDQVNQMSRISNKYNFDCKIQQDLCFYNYLCSYPFYGLSDFNHVFSNVGYGLLGLLFVVLVYIRDRDHQHNVYKNRNNPPLEITHGLVQQFGLYYAMGVALILEGILSACYHICPNKTNFQFGISLIKLFNLKQI